MGKMLKKLFGEKNKNSHMHTHSHICTCIHAIISFLSLFLCNTDSVLKQGNVIARL